MKTFWVVIPFGDPQLAPVARLCRELIQQLDSKKWKIVVICETRTLPSAGVEYVTTKHRISRRWKSERFNAFWSYVRQISFSKRFLKQRVRPSDKVLFINFGSLMTWGGAKKAREKFGLQLELPFSLSPFQSFSRDRRSWRARLFYTAIQHFLEWVEKRLHRMEFLVLSNAQRAKQCEGFFRTPSFWITNLPTSETKEQREKTETTFPARCLYHGAISGLREYGRILGLGAVSSQIQIDCFGPIRSDVEKDWFFQRLSETGVRYGGVLEHRDMLKQVAGGRYHWGILFYTQNEENHRLCAPMKLYEFLQFGIPVLVTSNPPLLEVVHRFGCGLVWDRETPEQMAEKILSADWTFFQERARKAYEVLRKEGEEELRKVVFRMVEAKKAEG